MVEMAGIAETYHFAQLERVHPAHGGAEVVAQPHAFKSPVVKRLILHQRVRARQVACDVRAKKVQSRVTHRDRERAAHYHITCRSLRFAIARAKG